jgi:NTE family protein
MRNIQLADILLAADVKGFGAEDFTKSAQIIPKGVDAAARKKALLGNLSAPGTAWDSYIAARSARRQTGVPVPEFISATGTGPKAERAIESALSFSLHKPADPERIDAALNVLAGKGSFNSLSYGLIKRDGTDGLLIRAEEKSYGPPFLNLGLTIDGSDPNDVRLGVGARLTFMNFGGYGSEWRTDLFFGTAYGVNTEYYHPFTPGSPWFVAARGSANRSQFDVYNNKNRVAQYGITRAGAGADLGYRLGRLAEVRLGEDAVLVSGTLRIGEPIAPNGSRTLSDTSIRFQYFGQDDVILPHEGLIQQTRFDHFSNGSSGGAYNSFQEQSSYFIPTTSRGSIVVSASGGSSFGAKQLGLESFSLGGPFHLGAYGINELLGNQYFLAQAGYYRKLFDLNPLLGGDGVYALALYEAGKVYGNPVAPHLPMDGSVALVAKTALGPVYIGGSASGSRFKWWFGLGRVF